MKVNLLNQKQNFGSIYNNKVALKGLEKISEHGSSFSLGVSCVGALLIRPLVIQLSPIEKENKKTISSESVASALSKFAVAQMFVLPIENVVKKIENNPKSFFKTQTLNNLNKKDLNFLYQIVKLGAGLVSSIPKSLVSVALIPLIVDLISKKKDEKKEIKSKQVSFNGNFSKILAHAMEFDFVQKFAKKNSSNSENIARNMNILSDVALCGASILGVNKSKKIEKKEKKILTFNKIISTSVSILSGCAIDKIVKDSTKNVVEKFMEINKNNPKLEKYVDGLNILRPTLVFALIYYVLIPFVSAILSDKMVKEGNNSA